MSTNNLPNEHEAAVEERSGSLTDPLPRALSSRQAPGAPSTPTKEFNDYDADDWRPEDSARAAGNHPATDE
jgi:hypothetical protein